METIKPRKKLTQEERLKVFFGNTPVEAIADFCKKNRYCVVIVRKDYYYMQKED